MQLSNNIAKMAYLLFFTGANVIFFNGEESTDSCLLDRIQGNSNQKTGLLLNVLKIDRMASEIVREPGQECDSSNKGSTWRFDLRR